LAKEAERMERARRMGPAAYLEELAEFLGRLSAELRRGGNVDASALEAAAYVLDRAKMDNRLVRYVPLVYRLAASPPPSTAEELAAVAEAVKAVEMAGASMYPGYELGKAAGYIGAMGVKLNSKRLTALGELLATAAADLNNGADARSTLDVVRFAVAQTAAVHI
jgi:hypothetical protein